ncbi:phage holin family protein [Schaalia sp. 19OD2882]|uniref:phage holin family protein n=1 Tax=Schaalia sp. 19OD2882 TaxID=2794089 RepID=UPI001C1F1799|nr:phage holin family protein [Schaalia sp. 19OD2882]QWW19766.1 phage holin family protein [Schaalia sp. 19OD2882]
MSYEQIPLPGENAGNPVPPAPPTNPTQVWTQTSSSARPATIGALLANISTQMTTLVKGELELAKAKAVSFGTKYGVGAGLLGTAGVLGLYALGWFFHTIEVALAAALPAWAASFIVLLIILLIVAALGVVGALAIKKAKEESDQFQVDMKESLASNVDAVKKGLGK